MKLRWRMAVLGFVIACMWFDLKAQGKGAALDGVGGGKLVADYDIFGIDLLKHLIRKEARTNLFFSPASGAISLAMLSEAAEGETKAEILAVLHANGLNTEDFKSANTSLFSTLYDTAPTIAIESANSLWFDSKFPLKMDFVEVLRHNYGCMASNLDLSRPEARAIIDDWCKTHTHGKITSMADKNLASQLQMLLLNAVYFKGTWETRFDPKLTQLGEFTLPTGQVARRSMMKRTGRFRYSEGFNFQAVFLPYESEDVGMYIFLPGNAEAVATLSLPGGGLYSQNPHETRTDLASFVKSLDFTRWNEWLGEFSAREGTVELPRFRVETTYDLSETLKDLGVLKAFSNEADLGNASSEKFSVSQVLQKASVDIDETGTVAAAATGVYSFSADESKPPFSMVVDRPFLVVIVENRTGLILFLGAIWNPE